jgi:hypothetical protein
MWNATDQRNLEQLIKTIHTVPWLLNRLGDEPYIRTKEDVQGLLQAFDTWPEWLREALGYRFSSTWKREDRQALEKSAALYQTGTVTFRPSSEYAHGVEVVGNDYDLAVKKVRELFLLHGALPFGRSSSAALPTDFFTVLFLEGETDVVALKSLFPDLPDITPLPRSIETRTQESYLNPNSGWYWLEEQLWNDHPQQK